MQTAPGEKGVKRKRRKGKKKREKEKEGKKGGVRRKKTKAGLYLTNLRLPAMLFYYNSFFMKGPGHAERKERGGGESQTPFLL